MKFEYTLAELSTAITALEQVYGKVSVLDPYLGTVLDPATLQPTDKAEELTALDETGRGVQLAQADDGPELVLYQGIQADARPCVLAFHCCMPHNLQSSAGAENSFNRVLAQMQEELRRETTQKRAEAAQRLAENRAALAEESERITRELEPQLSDLALDLVNHLQHWQDDRHSAVDAETIAAPYADIEHLTAGEHTNATTNRTK